MIYSFQELLWLCAAAIVIDLIVGDPKWPTHPVILIGRLVKRLERLLRPEGRRDISPAGMKLRGAVLTLVTIAVSAGAMWAIVTAADAVHPWAGYAVSAWFISTTIAVKGLKDAAMLVYVPLVQGDLEQARKYAGYIVSRDTHDLSGKEAARAAVETVAENTVDAFVSPIFFALIGGAPLAMLYRSANTLDSMVGYRNEAYLHFGWCSARLDDALNFIPARMTGLLLIATAGLMPGLRAGRGWRAWRSFAKRHPSPNSGIPESVVAGALGIELGGVNRYFGAESERARMGWPERELSAADIKATIRMLYGACVLILTGLVAARLWIG
ncbi:adenosylcobinamide-phosphate synthase CbiB [Paenibacillus soyae]|uniref:Cobalamin biosynthesis protein CobD n=1 Tax=Paenibacillus soyae TaxID=2969249 RepID=A0A9X2MY07_9BACL|nr:adenosylcobinamide-phosphate synthase CbiB [Paenibacillus soyae]MCR2805527.1 adenosylcobinamide-phosphate synthase CbiB [Paenibacillus soyae]